MSRTPAHTGAEGASGQTPAHTGAEGASGQTPAPRDEPGAEIHERFPLAMYSVGADGQTGHISPALQRVLGYPQGGSNWQLFHVIEQIHPDDRDRVLQELAGGRETLEPFRMEYRLQRHDGAFGDEHGRGEVVRLGTLA